jgi:hypothetical protein
LSQKKTLRRTRCRLCPYRQRRCLDPDHDIVAVVRWIDGGAGDGFVKRLIAAVD